MTGSHGLTHLMAINADDVNAGWLAGVLILLLVIGTFLLWRSMNKQLGRINAPHRDEVEPGRPKRPGRGLNAPRPPVQDEPRQRRADELTDPDRDRDTDEP